MTVPFFDSVTTKDFGGPASSGAIPHTCTTDPNRLFLATFHIGGVLTDTTVSSCTYGGSALTSLASQTIGGVTINTEWWYLLAPSTGSNTFQATLSQNASWGVTLRSFSSVSQTSPFGTVAKGAATSSTPSVAVTSAVSQLVVDAITAKNGDTVTATEASTRTERSNFITRPGAGNNSTRAASSETNGGASVTMDWTLGASAQWTELGVGIKPMPSAGGGGSTSGNPIVRIPFVRPVTVGAN